MSKTMMLSLLDQSNTGDEILSILDSIVNWNVAYADDNEPTLNPIEF
jgi:hypothetical protein